MGRVRQREKGKWRLICEAGAAADSRVSAGGDGEGAAPQDARGRRSGAASPGRSVPISCNLGSCRTQKAAPEFSPWSISHFFLSLRHFRGRDVFEGCKPRRPAGVVVDGGKSIAGVNGRGNRGLRPVPKRGRQESPSVPLYLFVAFCTGLRRQGGRSRRCCCILNSAACAGEHEIDSKPITGRSRRSGTIFIAIPFDCRTAIVAVPGHNLTDQSLPLTRKADRSMLRSVGGWRAPTPAAPPHIISPHPPPPPHLSSHHPPTFLFPTTLHPLPFPCQLLISIIPGMGSTYPPSLSVISSSNLQIPTLGDSSPNILARNQWHLVSPP